MWTGALASGKVEPRYCGRFAADVPLAWSDNVDELQPPLWWWCEATMVAGAICGLLSHKHGLQP